MDSSATGERMIDVAVLDVPVEETRTARLLDVRTPGARLRRSLGLGTGESRVECVVYWPLALIFATARGRTLRGRAWTTRVATAADRVTGRCGIVDAELPPTRITPVAAAACVPVRWNEARLRVAWREFFWDYIVRRRRPLQPPELTIDRFEEVWLPYHVATANGRRYLVDLLTHRVDPLDIYPEVAGLLEPAAGPAEPLPRGIRRPKEEP